MKAFQTPNSCHSRKASAKVSRQPFAVISNCPEFQQYTNYLQNKVQGLEMRVKNLNSQHLDKSDNRSTTASKTTVNQSPFMQKKYGSNKQIETQSYYESIINKRLENISKMEQSPLRTENSQSVYGVLQGNCINKIQQLTKKLRTFKMVKDQNQDECAPSLAKIKYFCQEHSNDCFDFYRCTDLITLKYFIYLLVQELNNSNTDQVADYQEQIMLLKNQLDNQRFDQMTFKGQLKLQKMVVDTQALIQEIISVLQVKQNQNSEIKTLRDDVSTQKLFTTSFGQNLQEGYDSSISNYKTLHEERCHTQVNSKSKSPYCRQRKMNINLEMDSQQKIIEEQTVVNRQLMEKIFELQSNGKSDSQIKDLQEQIALKDETIARLQGSLENQDSEIYQELNQRILDINTSLDHVISKNQELMKENETIKEQNSYLKHMEQKYNTIISENSQQIAQLNIAIAENNNLKRISQQYEAECQGYQQQIMKLQEKCEAQLAQLQDQNDSKYLQQQISELMQQQQEQNNIINLVTDEALYFGQAYLSSVDIISRQQSDSLPTPMIMLQKDLNNKRSVVQQKVKILQQFKNNMRSKSPNLSLEHIELDQPTYPSNHNELMTMLIVQCHTIEKMIEL